MKKQLLSLIILLVSIFNYAQTTVAIPNDAFEAYLETTFAENIESDGSTTDGSITFTDINLVTEINFSESGKANYMLVTTITDLTGINQFVKLKNLYCSNNDITGSLDLSGLASLTNFSCFSNPNLTAINFTGCKKLYNLKVNDCALTSIDISVNTLDAGADPSRLRYIALQNNGLTNINITGNTGLYKIDAYDNEALTSIDLSSSTLLTTLRFQNCNVTGDLDVSANTLLETLGSYNNDNLTSIKLGAIPYTNFNYFKISLSDNLSCVLTDNPIDFRIGGALETAIGDSYAVDAETNFVVDAAACSAILGTQKFGQIDFEVNPNVIKNRVHVSIAENANYKLININGKVLREGSLSQGENNIVIKNTSSGIYFLRVTTKKGAISSKKLIIQ